MARYSRSRRSRGRKSSRSYGGFRRRSVPMRSRGRARSRSRRGGGRQRVEIVFRNAPTAAAGNLLTTDTGFARPAGMSDAPRRSRF